MSVKFVFSVRNFFVLASVMAMTACSVMDGIHLPKDEDAGSQRDARVTDVARDRSVVRDSAIDSDTISDDVDDAFPPFDVDARDVSADVLGPGDTSDVTLDRARDSTIDSDTTDTSLDRVADTSDARIPPTTACRTTFRFVPASGTKPTQVAITGEWNAFASPGAAMVGPDAQGVYTASVELSPGVVAYKLLLDGQYTLDPDAPLRKYVGGVENSALRVVDCHAPTWTLDAQTKTRAGAGLGRYTARLTFVRGQDGPAVDTNSVAITLRHDSARTPLPLTLDAATGALDVDATNLADGKYTVLVEGRDLAGRAAKTARLVFWIEPTSFDWHDAFIYMAMVDRFKNGEPANDPPRQNAVDIRADFQGGDLQGVRNAITSGVFDRLGVNTLWLSPFHANANGAYLADDGVHLVTGYHGYWPVRAREVDARLGGEVALRALVTEAHAHGIRVLQDFVVNHVHKDHEYVAQHPSWFRSGCVCGTASCDWTTHRLDCVFRDYLPDVDWTVPAVSEQFGDDAVFWLDEFDIDGFRVDAVKHVEDACIVNLTARVREEFETAGTRVFMTGETAMGWNGDSVAANQSEYDTIRRYIGPHGLDGQFDFVLHHAAAYRTFDYDDKGLLHADFWTAESGRQYPADAIMTPYLDSQDMARSVTLATYRGQDAAHAREIATNNKWDAIAGAPTDGEPYARHRLATAWLMGLPGAPLLYYGDEYGQWGGADPNNRMSWRGDQALTGEEATTLAFVEKLGTARRELLALRRGAYRSVYGTDDDLVYARQAATGEIALVALTRKTSGTTITAPLGGLVTIANGTTLRDQLGGPSVVVSNAAVTITLGPRGAAILAP